MNAPADVDELHLNYARGTVIGAIRIFAEDESVVFSEPALKAFTLLAKQDRRFYLNAVKDLPWDVRSVLYREVERTPRAAFRGAAKPGGFRFITVGELLRKPRATWRVLRVIPNRGLIVLWGQPGSGKTFSALDLAIAIVRGLPWCGRRTKRGTVAYIAAEGALRERLDAYMAHHGIGENELAGLRILDSSVNLLEVETDVEPLMADLQRLAAETGEVAMVVIDTLNRAMPGGDENSSQDMGAVIATAKRIEEALGCAVLFVHHSGKDESKGSRGHSSLRGATDAEISIKREGDMRTVTAEKVRDAEDQQTLMSFRLRSVDLGPASDYDPDAEPDERCSSCVIEPIAPDTEAAPRASAPAGGNQRIAWDRMGELLRTAGEVRPEGAPPELPPGRPAITFEAAVEGVGSRLPCESKRRRERAIAAISALCARQVLRHVDGWIWCP
jgi:KaiC/GvpD/RAD55 family RecA-like ATPase